MCMREVWKNYRNLFYNSYPLNVGMARSVNDKDFNSLFLTFMYCLNFVSGNIYYFLIELIKTNNP